MDENGQKDTFCASELTQSCRNRFLAFYCRYDIVRSKDN